MDNNASIDKAALEANIARTVDKAALRKVRNLVDNYEREERAQKARQFNVMAMALFAIIALTVLGVFIAHGGKAPERGSGLIRQANARENCIDRSTERQLTALERDLRALNPGISPTELARRIEANRSVIYDSASSECKRQTSR